MAEERWKRTKIWEALEEAEPEGDEVRAFLVHHMKEIEKVLGDTAAKDFTFHDADHSFRVAKWMAEVVGEELLPKLTSYELALLLLSAYLHDVGMSPALDDVNRHWRHLAYGPGGDKPLSDEEAKALQEFLDEYEDGIEPPLAEEGRLTEEQKIRADRVITDYSRFKHNDWSERWMRKRFGGRGEEAKEGKAADKPQALGSYQDWLADLITVCRSHHEGYVELRKDGFDPRPAGRFAKIVHLRFLACVLRVADVLDVDPERTPDVIFHHRDVRPDSQLYWRKDHQTWVSVQGAEGTVTISARPESAVMHKAILDTANQIERELELCARLKREQPFDHTPHRPGEKLPHRWTFPERVNRQISPRNDAYVYIDGAFRPDTAKLLDLLAGHQLYGDRMVAVRELLQNAFDAVKERIALERLKQDDPGRDPTELRDWLKVDLRLEQRDDGRWWLVCRDDGVGMTRRIIEKFLLVSGRSRRREVVDLERRCRERGFELERTGQFGIGVLSYFMLADRVEIKTRRWPGYDPDEGHGWSFTTSGVGDFGELRKVPSSDFGSTVALRLEEALETGAGETPLIDYVAATFTHVPCSFHIGEAGTEKTWKPGWLLSGDDLTAKLCRELEGLVGEPGELASSRRREQLALERTRLRQLQEDLVPLLEWREVTEELPGGQGRYRILMPEFRLEEGSSPIYIPDLGDLEGDERLFGVAPINVPVFSWKGARLKLENPRVLLCQIQIDLVNPARNAELRIDRHALTGDDESLWKLADQVLERNRHGFGTSIGERYRAVAAGRSSSEVQLRGPVSWPVRDGEGGWVWSTLTGFVGGERFGGQTGTGSKITAAPRLPLAPRPTLNVSSFPFEQLNCRLHMANHPTPSDFGQSVKIVADLDRALSGPPVTRFPPAWRSVLGFVERYINRLSFLQNEDAVEGGRVFDWSGRLHHLESTSALEMLPEVASEPRTTFRMLLAAMLARDSDHWRGLVERQPEVVKSLWADHFGETRQLHVLVGSVLPDRLSMRYVRTFTTNSVEVVTGANWHEVLPDPGPEWTIVKKGPTPD